MPTSGINLLQCFILLKNYNLKNVKFMSEKYIEILISILQKVLKDRRKYVVVIIFAAAALLTPPDPITQIGLAIPLLILYELSIFSVNIIEKKNKLDA